MQRVIALGVVVLWTSSAVGAITTFTDRTAFHAAVAPTPLTIETFLTTGTGGQIPPSPGFFSIPSNTLNSSTVLGSLPAGVIQPGVTYSTPVNSQNFYVIDTGGSFSGGFLEGIKLGAPTFPLTITFDKPVSAFGFDTNNDMGAAFSVQIKFSDGPDSNNALTGPPTSALAFFGFRSSSANITQAIVVSTNPTLGDSFALDNFTFTNDPVAAVPEPSSLIIFAVGALVFGVTRRRRR